MASSPYFFTVYDNNGNPIPGISGTWSLYCAEDKFTPPSEGELILSQSFTTAGGEFGGYVEYNNGNPISVDSKYTGFGIVVQVSGYRIGLNTGEIKNPGRFTEVSTTSNFGIDLLTESEYITQKIEDLKNALSNRISAPTA
jgi:hypothetical protein